MSRLLELLNQVQKTEVVNLKSLGDVVQGLIELHPNPDLELPRNWRNYNDIQRVGWLIGTLPPRYRMILKDVIQKMLREGGYQRTSFAQKAKHLSGL